MGSFSPISYLVCTFEQKAMRRFVVCDNICLFVSSCILSAYCTHAVITCLQKCGPSICVHSCMCSGCGLSTYTSSALCICHLDWIDMNIVYKILLNYLCKKLSWAQRSHSAHVTMTLSHLTSLNKDQDTMFLTSNLKAQYYPQFQSTNLSMHCFHWTLMSSCHCTAFTGLCIFPVIFFLWLSTLRHYCRRDVWLMHVLFIDPSFVSVTENESARSR